MQRLWNALTMMVGLWVVLACGLDADDRMVRRYAGCMADSNTALHRLTASSAVGTVPLSAVGQPAFASARQPGEQPGLSGGQDLPNLFRRPVVGQLAGGHTPPILQWPTS